LEEPEDKLELEQQREKMRKKKYQTGSEIRVLMSGSCKMLGRFRYFLEVFDEVRNNSDVHFRNLVLTVDHPHALAYIPGNFWFIKTGVDGTAIE
jgi:hypothetical protein